MTENDPANRARDEADQERGVGEQGADNRIELGEKELVEDERRHHAVKKEIVPLNGRPNRACQGDFAD